MNTSLIFDIIKFGFNIYKEVKDSPISKEDLQNQKEQMLIRLKHASIEYDLNKNNNNNK
jgi:hypothetical protein